MPESRATLVLVHGAWHDSECWQRVLPLLGPHFKSAVRVELPSGASPTPAGLEADASHLNETLAGIDGPVVLCGHSYGGMVISAADPTRCELRHLFYVCAYLAEPGESLDSSLRNAGERRPGHWIRRLSDGRTCVDRERAGALFYNDCDDETRSLAISQLRPHWGAAFTDAGSTAAWRSVPATYVVCTLDQALSPRLQREVYAPRAVRLATLVSGHSPFLSVPQQLAQVLVS